MYSKEYKVIILYFLVFSLLLVFSSISLFEHKISFNIEAIQSYYLGNLTENITAKTPLGLLKIVLPHLFVFGLFSMVLLHFLIFTKERGTLKAKLLIYIIFLSAFVEILSAFLILLNIEIFAYVKLFSFILFEVLTIYTIFLLFRSILIKV